MSGHLEQPPDGSQAPTTENLPQRPRKGLWRTFLERCWPGYAEARARAEAQRQIDELRVYEARVSYLAATIRWKAAQLAATRELAEAAQVKTAAAKPEVQWWGQSKGVN